MSTQVYLNRVTEIDRRRLLTWRNSPDVARYMYSDHTISAGEHDRWFDSMIRDTTRLDWIIATPQEPVGLASLQDVKSRHRRCSWAFYLAEPSCRGKGIGSSVEFAIIDHALRALGLNKICCEVLSSNEQVLRMHEGFGFNREANLRDHINKGGAFHDVIALGLLARDWETLRSGILDRMTSRGIAPAMMPES